MRDPIPHPEFGAGIDAWEAWVNEVLPYRADAFDGPAELRLITRLPDRKIAAVAAEQWFRRQSREAPARRVPQQRTFDGEHWQR